MFRTDLLSIIRNLNTVITTGGICHVEILKLDNITNVYTRTCTLLVNCRTSCPRYQTANISRNVNKEFYYIDITYCIFWNTLTISYLFL